MVTGPEEVPGFRNFKRQEDLTGKEEGSSEERRGQFTGVKDR